MDFIVTSGPDTGQEASFGKIKKMKKALGDFLLAIAGGITSENIIDYPPFADCFLVATGISSNFYELDSILFKRMMENTNQFLEEK